MESAAALHIDMSPSRASGEPTRHDTTASSYPSSGRSLLHHSTSSRASFFSRDDGDHKGIELVVYGVSCAVGRGKRAKETLRCVSGVVEPGEFYGVMGPSGGGKTTLLDIVCLRKSVGRVKGAVLYNGKVPTRAFAQHNVAYVEQEITVQSAFTVEEAITFSAILKRSPRQFSRKEINRTVDHVIDQLGLARIRKSRVGNSRLVRGISGGEARRLSIGISLVQLTKPGLLCLDEPTTGLDSAIGNDILKLIKGCSHEGWTVVTTIHNPSAHMMNHLDGLILLVASNVIWFGPYNREEIYSTYESKGFVFEPEMHSHAVEDLIQLAGGGSAGADEAVLKRACEAYKASQACKGNRESAEASARAAGIPMESAMEWKKPCSLWKGHQQQQTKEQITPDDPSLVHACGTNQTFANNPFQETLILLKFRTFTLLKDPNFVLSRLLIFAVFALVFATFFANRQPDMNGLVDTMAILFAIPITLSLPFGLFIPELFNQRKVFIREQHEGCYRSLSYCVSIFLTEVLLTFVGALIYTGIVYFAIGTFPMTLVGFVFFCLNIFGVALSSALFANFAANMSPTMEVAMIIAPCYWLWNCLVMGFITQYRNMPVYYAWTYWAAYLQYGFSGSMLNQFQDETWNMCTTLGQYWGMDGGRGRRRLLQSEDSNFYEGKMLSIDGILNALTNGEIGNETAFLLDQVQHSIQAAVSFRLPFKFSDATCASETQAPLPLPDFVSSHMPSQSTLQTIIPLAKSFLGLNGGGAGGGDGSGGGGRRLTYQPTGKPLCDELCLPVPGNRLLTLHGVEPFWNMWDKLGMVFLFVFIHFIFLCAITMVCKRFDRR